jgi:hypothetical protein
VLGTLAYSFRHPDHETPALVGVDWYGNTLYITAVKGEGEKS